MQEGAPSKKVKKKRSRRSRVLDAVLYTVCAALFIGGGYILFREFVLITEPYSPPPKEITPPPNMAMGTPDPNVTPDPNATPEPRRTPEKLYFTEREIMCDVLPVGVNSDGAMDTLDSHNQAAWAEYGPSPGEEGNAIINGHVRFRGKKGYFSILKDMEIGEEVAIEYNDGSVRYFKVRSVDTYYLYELPPTVMGLGGDTRLTLITCLGDFNHDIGTSEHRVVVVCDPA